tara:strand:- start:472 stop:582 length:111 start_codon:yes stop_codon:yes gene_type:complete
MTCTPFDLFIIIGLSNLSGFLLAEAIHLYYLGVTHD